MENTKVDYSRLYYQQMQVGFLFIPPHSFMLATLVHGDWIVLAVIWGILGCVFYLLFGIITVIVYGDSGIGIKYGFYYGSIIELPFNDIASIKKVKNSFWNQFRWQNISTNFIYSGNANGIFEIIMKNGRQYRIAIGRPKDFIQAVNKEKYRFPVKTA